MASYLLDVKYMQIVKLGKEKWPNGFERVLHIPVDGEGFEVTLRPFGYTAVVMDIHQNGIDTTRAWALAISDLMSATDGGYIRNMQLPD